MSKHETPMTRWYWAQLGGTLIEEFCAVPRAEGCGGRWIDGVIIKGGEFRIVKKSHMDMTGKDIVVVQAKAMRLGMYLMGQALFSAELMNTFHPRSIASVALVMKSDAVLQPLFERHSGMHVVVCPPDVMNRTGRVHATKTVLYGDIEAPVLARDWLRTAGRLPYRQTHLLKPGQHWVDAAVTDTLWEHYVHQTDGTAIPAGAMIARELIAEGAETAVWTDCYGAGRLVLMSPDLVCAELTGELSRILQAIRDETGKRWAGVPDAIGLFADGRIALREAKVAGKDRVSETQHTFARAARKLLGDKVEFAAAEWGREKAEDKK